MPPVWKCKDYILIWYLQHIVCAGKVMWLFVSSTATWNRNNVLASHKKTGEITKGEGKMTKQKEEKQEKYKQSTKLKE